ncbi:DUF1127 domain-containing protein [Phaeobacter gallaeciensis]|uniref:Small protein n=1 Tax=Phaeobacter gallaeciensis TaxID=60890 RepID=A0AAC9Z7Q6_9RHOB|nr:hypothetical protein [Phaeobacter gallaeciensis]AHD08979.1 putative small protein [Phaeobacter gallaeciensis DSM 26640]ATE92245.1 putative small protein [Phaeobacter gallaeciensis]ATE97936.1 putative small protein [Phaeobacter gallaeciensis]ATF00907.1 putative small protein [Phaeobacter gallaeciensis]ATF05287.1 putative small protein [Phaeobacter gallaeciensis]
MTYMDNSLRSNACAPRRSIMATVAHALAVWRERRMLAQLDSSALEDMGISQRDAEAEARRPIWDAPNNWTR